MSLLTLQTMKKSDENIDQNVEMKNINDENLKLKQYGKQWET